MLTKLKRILFKNRSIKFFARRLKFNVISAKLYFKTKKHLRKKNNSFAAIFYIGIPAHSNLGDLAQGYCIRRWIGKHYSGVPVFEIETNALVNTRYPLLKLLKKKFNKDDIIIFQSGYTTTDLGGFADEMHRAVMNVLPEARMLMMPQTIFFQSEENKNRTALCYNSMKNMLFLARDNFSLAMAKEMFPDIAVLAFPDIVTTLIGRNKRDNARDGILFCCRDDSEKFYSDAEIDAFISSCVKFGKVEKTDTTKHGKVSKIVSEAEKYIFAEIDSYAKYKLIITDRYHGTIFSLIAGTPVIIIKTTDHKVVTGAQWFKGVYDDYVHVANDLKEAESLAEKILSKGLSHNLSDYFEKEYYDKLRIIFEQSIEKEK